MTAPLDLTVARALMRWRLMERAVHDRGSWSMRYAGITVPATRFIREDRVTLVAHFPAMCPLTEPDLRIDLLIDGEQVHAIALEDFLPEDGYQVQYDLMVFEPVPVR